jgi:hypothetical protein
LGGVKVCFGKNPIAMENNFTGVFRQKSEQKGSCRKYNQDFDVLLLTMIVRTLFLSQYFKTI